MSKLLERITVNPKQCGGRPCIRGMRIRVSDVLDLFVAGLSAEQILEELPYLETDDLRFFVTWYGSIGGHKSTKSLSGKRLN